MQIIELLISMVIQNEKNTDTQKKLVKFNLEAHF